jgi:hypothetical protein
MPPVVLPGPCPAGSSRRIESAIDVQSAEKSLRPSSADCQRARAGVYREMAEGAGEIGLLFGICMDSSPAQMNTSPKLTWRMAKYDAAVEMFMLYGP